ncbi:hypothetical protein TPA0910_17270 [Streptomyces hygroscopicus subsp. sporocinereus]|uniref:DUF397 domain-containing protein n=1 Tax=Streptomyces hygroscopicus TaxID=1912 RepID=A0ABQ3TVH4_STRHY|nr:MULTISPECIES: DUF397 domain-containing protein [Streptomyces]MDN3053140.1 DUF397 domain-containing protein [Streptomyces sp. SRF1]GHJ27294.1 hypothetical protein TPA0910_17270 [Streptomyces hygroscopicus]
MPTYQWRKSTYSPNSSNCVNVATRDGVVLLRESDDPDVVLTLAPPALRAFIRAVRAGEFDRTLNE